MLGIMHFEVIGDVSGYGGVWDEGELAWSEMMLEWLLIESLSRDTLGLGHGYL